MTLDSSSDMTVEDIQNALVHASERRMIQLTDDYRKHLIKAKSRFDKMSGDFYIKSPNADFISVIIIISMFEYFKATTELEIHFLANVIRPLVRGNNELMGILLK